MNLSASECYTFEVNSHEKRFLHFPQSVSFILITTFLHLCPRSTCGEPVAALESYRLLISAEEAVCCRRTPLDTVVCHLCAASFPEAPGGARFVVAPKGLQPGDTPTLLC